MAPIWRVEEGDAGPGAAVPAQGPLLSTGLVSSLLSEVLLSAGGSTLACTGGTWLGKAMVAPGSSLPESLD